MNILILTGRFGMGHYSASLSIKQQIEKEFYNADVSITDIFEYTMPNFHKAIYGGFKLLVSKANFLYNFVYKNSDEFDATLPFTDAFVNKIDKLIKVKKPDVIISTLPLCSRIVSKYKEKTNSKLPLVTCITDISTHNEWISSHTNIYLVATESVKDNLIQSGVKAESILISGIPVNQQFKNSNLVENSQIKNNYKNLLIMGGGLGLIPVGSDFYEKLNGTKNLKVTVILGNNKKEYNKLHGKYDNIEVIGYTDKVNEYMNKADLIISKAGGITVFETIYSELPMLVLYPFLEQEKNNAFYIENKGIGEIIWDKYQDIATKAINILSDDLKLKKMKNNMAGIKSAVNHDFIINVISNLKIVEVA